MEWCEIKEVKLGGHAVLLLGSPATPMSHRGLWEELSSYCMPDTRLGISICSLTQSSNEVEMITPTWPVKSLVTC